MVRTQILRAAPRSLYICQTCRNAQRQTQRTLQSSPHPPARNITQNHIEKIKRAEQEWHERAELIKAGHAPTMLSRLEERGYVNQIVG